MAKPSRALVARRVRKGIKKHTPDVLVVDLKDHVMGRAAAVIAKQLMLGRRITAVHCDQLNIAGPMIRNKIRYLQFLRKKKNTNPKLGPFHQRAPSDVFTRVVRSMLPRYAGKKGASCLRRLISYEGIPPNISRKGGRAVIPKALRRLRLRKERPFTVLGSMCENVGWKYKGIVDKLEEARLEKAARHYQHTQPIRDAWKKANASALTKISKDNLAVLKKFGQA